MTDAELKSRIDTLTKQIAEIDRTLADGTYWESLDPKDAAARKEALEAAKASYNSRVRELYNELSDVRGDRPARKDLPTSRDPGPIFADDTEPVDYSPSSDPPDRPSTSGDDFLRHAGRAVGVPSSLLPKRTAPTFEMPEPKSGESPEAYNARAKGAFDQEKKAADQADQLSGDLISMAVKAVLGMVTDAVKAPAVIGEAAASATFAEKPTDFLHSGGKAIEGFSDLTMGMIPGLGTVGKFVGALGSAIDQLNKWSDGLHQTNMGFAEFSGAMAQVQAESQVRKIVLDQQRGDVRAEAARRLSEARDRRERATGELMDAFHNRVSAPAMEKVENLLAEVSEYLKKVFGVNGPPAIEGDTLGEWIYKNTDADFARDYGVSPAAAGLNADFQKDLLNRMRR